MPEDLLAALIIGKIKGFKVSVLFRSKAFYPIFAYDIILLSLLPFIRTNGIMSKLSSIVSSIGFLLFLIPIIKYKIYKQTVWGAACIIAGTILNRVVISVNGGKMPVYPTVSRFFGLIKPQDMAASLQNDSLHMLGNASVRLIILSDIIDLGYGIFSIGDLFVRVFGVVITYSAIKQINSQKSNS